MPVCILGGGPAGSAAAVAALRSGAAGRILERSRLPRHKVCGEFLSPGILGALHGLGLASQFQDLKPARIRRMLIRVGGAEKAAPLPEIAYGLSRYVFDQWLWDTAMAAGAERASTGEPDVICSGRASNTPRGGRLFGFKAHFRGPADDSVELYFAGRTYVGVNCVEDGLTNVCGLAPEEDLKRCEFDVDALVTADPAVRARLGPLRRQWDWIFTGPLQFGNKLAAPAETYLAGDALSFVDPFTGSGLLCAVLTGSLAGEAAARRTPVPEFVAECARRIRKPFGFSSVIRQLATTRAAGPLLRLTPADLIFRWTRPTLLSTS